MSLSATSLHHNPSVSSISNDYMNGNALEDDDDSIHHAIVARERPRRRESSLASSHSGPLPAQSRSNTAVVLAIDYGTTFTGVAWQQTGTDTIEVRQDWGPGQDNEFKIRTAISYCEDGDVQWGNAIDHHRTTMVNTKLELEPQKSRFDELDLTYHVLKGVGNLSFKSMIRHASNPPYSPNTPQQIATDYLKEIFHHVSREQPFSNLAAANTPLDIVLTIPVGWSYQAKSSLFKAIRGAGFNRNELPTLRDTILVSEPEAASYFTARELRDRGETSNPLKINDVFVLCDAGGGTVDVVSFQVSQLSPDLGLQKITSPDGDKVGSALIDLEFKTWLRNVIGSSEYEKIDPTNAQANQKISPHAGETGPMRQIMKNFIDQKHKFSKGKGDGRPIRVELAAPLNELTIPGRVESGSLIIPRNEMAKLMNPCVSGVIRLIKQQAEQAAHESGTRVWNTLLVGGFGSSPYLQQELKRSLDRMEPPVGLRPPSDERAQKTAVVQGAVIYGMEKGRHRNATYLAAVTKYYGVVVDGRFEWLINKGDLTLSDKESALHAESGTFSFVVDANAKGPHELSVFVYNPRNEHDTWPPKTWKEGSHEVRKVGTLKIDLTKYIQRAIVPPTRFGRITPPAKTVTVEPLKWRWDVKKGRELEAELVHGPRRNTAQLGTMKIMLDVDSSPPRPMALGRRPLLEEDDSD